MPRGTDPRHQTNTVVRKRTTLPRDFEGMLLSAPLDELTAVFGRCELDARHGHDKTTAIGMVDCPDQLVVWLVQRGLDIDTPDSYGRTPLARRASRGRDAQIPLLLSLGADIDARDASGQSPLQAAVRSSRAAAAGVLLEHGASARGTDRGGRTLMMQGLVGTRNIDIPAMATIAEMLVQRGEPSSPEMRAEVERIGRDFEFHRDAFDPAFLAVTEAGLDAMYRLFDVTPVERLLRHDGISRIVVPEGDWQRRHAALWDVLVPPSGPAESVQGEVIRVTGRLGREIVDNGRANWDADYRTMLDAVPGYLSLAEPLSTTQRAEAESAVKRLRSGHDEPALLDRLSELAVQWVARNPTPVRLGAVGYKR